MAQLTQALFTERGPERYKKRSIGSSDLSPSESRQPPSSNRPLAEPWGHHTSSLTTCPRSNTPTSSSPRQQTLALYIALPGPGGAAHTCPHPYYRHFFPSSRRLRPWQRRSINPGCSTLATPAPGDIPSNPPTSPSSLHHRQSRGGRQSQRRITPTPPDMP